MTAVCGIYFSKVNSAILFCAVLLVFGGASATYAQDAHTIAEIQGDKNSSPFENKLVRVSGIVTARTKTGFYLQTPDDKIDKNPATSEGVFVYTKTEPTVEATIGNAVTVNGYVNEFRPKAEPLSLSITEISMRKTDVIEVNSKNNALPKPIVLTVDDFKSNQIDQLEKYEGMRVTVPELTVVAPTGAFHGVDEKTGTSVSDGTFYAVVKGLPRPFREAGYDVYDYAFLPAKEKDELKKNYPKLTIFDHNPERLRIESTAQLGGQAIDVPANAEIKNLTGVISYGYRAYAIEVDADNRPEISKIGKAIAVQAPNERQFSIASMNVERFFDDEDDPAIKEPIISSEGFERRLKKVSLAIRNYLQTPDVVAFEEMESLPTLKKLAERVNKDAVTDGKPNPKYEPYLVEGNDISGIDSGYLVKSSRVEVLETKQFGKDDQFQNPVSKKDVSLFDRPPLLLRARIKDAKTCRSRSSSRSLSII